VKRTEVQGTMGTVDIDEKGESLEKGEREATGRGEPGEGGEGSDWKGESLEKGAREVTGRVRR